MFDAGEHDPAGCTVHTAGVTLMRVRGVLSSDPRHRPHIALPRGDGDCEVRDPRRPPHRRTRTMSSQYHSGMDRLGSSPWSTPETVAGFVNSPANDVLLNAAAKALHRFDDRRLLDIGCGAGRNAVPLARMGWNVLGTDLSAPMLVAARDREVGRDDRGRLWLALAPMEHL